MTCSDDNVYETREIKRAEETRRVTGQASPIQLSRAVCRNAGTSVQYEIRAGRKRNATGAGAAESLATAAKLETVLPT